MQQLTRESLAKLREKQAKEFDKKNSSKIKIIIGMGSCGIAAGAKDAETAIRQELEKKNIKDFVITQAGCMGNCFAEPIVEIVMPGMPATIYGKVTPEIGTKIVQKHIVNKTLVNKHVQDQQAADLI